MSNVTKTLLGYVGVREKTTGVTKGNQGQYWTEGGDGMFHCRSVDYALTKAEIESDVQNGYLMPCYRYSSTKSNVKSMLPVTDVTGIITYTQALARILARQNIEILSEQGGGESLTLPDPDKIINKET